ncbi:50S ribosomal protein L21 [Mycoplasmoides alvi]|uniref:50S ribosomal protein L21 n=1 Tax=Mycoplasmoides alvi TaxID=78580 RepID=UPI00051CA486|nr:50S ribosomal protein L21 [Mycoplasmoides alvi]
MFAVVMCGSKQYLIHEKDEIYVEKIKADVGSEIVIDKVLMIDNRIGKPYLENAKVVCLVEKQGKQKKINVIKHISQKHHLKKYGHRQPYTKLKVISIKG